MVNRLLKIDAKDNVAVALTPIKAGETITVSDGSKVLIAEDIIKNFKVALTSIAKGAEVIKYGYPIGNATTDIAIGAAVHSHNTATGLKGSLEYDITLSAPSECSVTAKFRGRTFKGYERKNGNVGIRNEIYILPTVGCVNELCGLMASRAIKATGKEDIYVFKHPYGCSQLGEDMLNTQKILKGLLHHPNAGAVLVVSLGCENNNLKEFKAVLGDYDEERVRFLVAQDSGDEIEAGLKVLTELIGLCAKDERTDVDISRLNVGLKCGGSDALSGITANPLVGKVCDVMSCLGGGVIMTEVPEMFGAEHILMERSKDTAIRDDIINMVNGFKEYFIAHGESVGENPSPGNKDGGITTLEEKSLGCIQKGGKATVMAVLKYGDSLTERGLNLLEGPGNDIVAQTVLTTAGAHIIMFTTGRGTPLGAPAPTVKIATNSELAAAKPNWIDFDAGRLLGTEGFEELTEELIEQLLRVASGEPTKNELNGYREIAIWKSGVTL